jgi:hypothetical protein
MLNQELQWGMRSVEGREDCFHRVDGSGVVGRQQKITTRYLNMIDNNISRSRGEGG